MKFATDDPVIEWLLDGDVSIQYQTWRDLLGKDRPDLQARLATEGWGAAFLANRHPDGHWGDRFYQPKWISSHYTLLDLKNMALPPDNQLARDSIRLICETEKVPDGGVGPERSVKRSDVCVNAMFLNYASYFGEDERRLSSLVDFLIGQHLHDGGFNCRSTRGKVKHSSLHSTIAVLEAVATYRKCSYGYRLDELSDIADTSIEFILQHHLFKSDRTGDIIHQDFLKLPYPWRWKYNILRALDAFKDLGIAWDPRMQDSVDVLVEKRRPDGRWPCNAAHPGQVHMIMDKAGKPGRWNTLIALRTLKHFGQLQG